VLVVPWSIAATYAPSATPEQSKAEAQVKYSACHLLKRG
jgi:hypothetical protein